LTLILSGDWRDAAEMTLALLQSGFRLEFAPASVTDAKPRLVAIARSEDFPLSVRGWLAWLRVDDPALTLAAYQHGARAVFPPDMPPSLLVQALLGLDADLSEPGGAERQSNQRQIRRGDPVFLEADTVLTIHEGILATMMVHSDGAEVLLGLTGAGQILVAHPDDECFIQVLAHTPAVVSCLPWEQAVLQPGFSEKLRTRLQRMEAWAAMQARPYLAQRVLGILSLLAEQFGAPHSDGIVIDLRLTHAQLAAAVGATRTTITRVLGELRAAGKLSADGSGRAERFVLCRETELAHH
jgi:CRP-like cAMP-binding protein